MIPLLLEDVLGAIGLEVGLWLTLIMAALYSRKVLKIGSVAGQVLRYAAVAIGVVGLGMAIGAISLDVARVISLGGTAISTAVDLARDLLGGLL